ncbi:MAG: GNAT family N-acetyltransferase [Candidatus Sphingomonas colombiensis]|nr:GNAT family N-acetyltransferase [Sphingomonas sp.]WEK41822.1 MAG: GNAT family N-acetyltransferase [Sphingomonas sp.]
MSAPPMTVLSVPPEEAEAIRSAVRAPDLAALGPERAIAGPEHVAGLLALLRDPAVSDPIYDLPRPFTIESIGRWVEDARRKQANGEAILAVALDDDGAVISYSYFTIWPERSAAELAGAIRVDRQQSGNGRAGAARSFQWMFHSLGVRLIGLTAALDNDRSARVIEAAGFVAKGVRDSVRPDGSIRQSRYWELLRDQGATAA